jgi:nucleotide-binding universal stress UspA family protein
MINILVPTDFSALSKIAFKYAIKIANEVNGTVTLLHSVSSVEPVTNAMRHRVKPVENEVMADAHDQLQKLIRSMARSIQFSQAIRSSVIKSSDTFPNVVNKEAKKHRIGLIVMGTHGASGIRKVVVGSNTNGVIGSSKVPVLAIPEHAEFKGFRNIIYASDLKNFSKELATISPYVKKFDSTLHVVHVVKSGKDVPEIEEKVEGLAAKAGHKDAVVMIFADGSIDEGIEQYIGLAKADLLAMFTHRLTFYEKLMDSSVTRRMAFHSRVPLLAFRQTLK